KLILQHTFLVLVDELIERGLSLLSYRVSTRGRNRKGFLVLVLKREIYDTLKLDFIGAPIRGKPVEYFIALIIHKCAQVVRLCIDCRQCRAKLSDVLANLCGIIFKDDILLLPARIKHMRKNLM